MIIAEVIVLIVLYALTARVCFMPSRRLVLHFFPFTTEITIAWWYTALWLMGPLIAVVTT